MKDARPTRQCTGAVRGSDYRSGRALPPGFGFEVEGPTRHEWPISVDTVDTVGTGVNPAADRPQRRVGSDGVDPVTNALGYWGWMLDHGYDPSSGNFPTQASWR